MTEVTKPIQIRLAWDGARLFAARNAKGMDLTLDGDTRDGLSPMEGVLACLCSCIGIDIADILTKMRLAPDTLEITATGARNPVPPKYFRAIDVSFRFRGDLPKDKVERAVQLSLDKYCSVYHSLRPDLKLTHRLVIES